MNRPTGFFLLVMLLTVGSAIADVHEKSRWVRDVSGFDLRKVTQAEGQAWIVAKITPSPASGHLRISGAFIQGGEVVVPPDGRAIVKVEGAVEALAVLAGKIERDTWTYAWDRPFDPREGEDEEIYSPFRQGGVAVVQYTPRSEGLAAYARVIAIPPDWARLVSPALRAIRRQAVLFGTPATVEKRDQLEALLRSPNPFLAVAALRALTELYPADAGPFHHRLQSSAGLTQAIFAFLVIERIPEGVREITAAAESADSAEELQGIALGAYTAMAGPSSRVVQERGHEVLRVVKEKSSRFEAGPATEDLRQILENVPPGDGDTARRDH